MTKAAIPRAPRKATWSRRVERQSLALPAELLREARANTRRVVRDLGFLATLAREVALTRGPELTLAYRNLVLVMPGFRRKRGARGSRVTGELCVVFVVRRKEEGTEGSSQHLPRWLITFADHEGVRQPFALPTDVQDANGHHAAVAHADSGLWVVNADWPPAAGSFAALVALRHDAGEQTCLLSAQHVLTPFSDGTALTIADGLDVLPLATDGARASAPVLGTNLPIGGLLRSDERPDRPSFDVQLASVAAAAEAEVRRRTPLRNLSPDRPWVRSLAELLALDRDGFFFLLTPDNHETAPGRGAIRMTLAHMPVAPVGIPYRFGEGPTSSVRDVYHAELLGFNAVGGNSPLPGDSGSPVIARQPDGTTTLAAMHIGGDGSGLSWAIPAWRLFDLGNWAQFPPGTRVAPVEP